MDAAGIREIFERHDLRWTKQREEVYAALCRSEAHPTADELYAAVNGRDAAAANHPGPADHISLATIYNCLDVFSRSGLCRRLASPAITPRGDGAFRYDADMGDHAHVVRSDGCVQDLPDDLSEEVLAHLPRELLDRIEQRLRMKIGRFGVEFFEARNRWGSAPPIE
ncbi:MAG: transcriptional repressor [Phycisphaerales bacterium]|nr:transcriptional repressor [Phycisphaerales bacterium]